MMTELGKIKGISFASMPDKDGDSATFLILLLPDTILAQKTVNTFNQNGVTGFNYWYTNMYHFINQWDHIKQGRVAAKTNVQLLGAPQDYANLELPQTQATIGRLISFSIKASWTDEELKNLVSAIGNSIQSVLK